LHVILVDTKNMQYLFYTANLLVLPLAKHVIQIYIILLFSTENSLVWKTEVITCRQ